MNSLKRHFVILLSVIMLLTLCACAENKQVKAVEDLISSIGKVTLDSQSQIEEARTAYDALDDENRTNVQNYKVLTDAKTRFEEIQPVELTVDNFKHYVSVEFEYSDYESTYGDKVIAGRAKMTITIKPCYAGTFENATFTLKRVHTGLGMWMVASGDSAADEQSTDDPFSFYEVVNLPSNGELTETHNLIAFQIPGSINNDFPTAYYVEEASGTFIPEA